MTYVSLSHSGRYKFLKVTRLVSRLAAFLPVHKVISEWLVVGITLAYNRTTATVGGVSNTHVLGIFEGK